MPDLSATHPSATKPTRREAARDRKRRQRERDRQIREAARKASQDAQERRDEEIAPNAQRTHVTAPDGSVARAARLVRDGVGFRRADPLAHIAAEIEGGSKMFTASQGAAGARLRVAWDMVGQGIGLGASDWGNIRAPRGTAPMTPAGHDGLVAQMIAQQELEAAATFLGALWPAIREMVLVGRSMSSWAAQNDMDRRMVPGYLRAGLDRLVEFWAPKRENPRLVLIRAIAPGRGEYSLEVVEEMAE
jgi:hypothetical protein